MEKKGSFFFTQKEIIMKYKKNESGRSMVEMLGVLAIIGVLSVGGIAGYSLSMRRHRANGVVDYISKFALTEYAKCQQEVLETGISTWYCSNKGTSYSPNSTQLPDIGTFPSGITQITTNDIYTASDDGADDKVDIDVKFYDQKLCQAVASVSGYSCGTQNNEHIINFVFKME